MQSNIPFSSQYDDCIHDLYRAFQAFKMQSIKIFPRYIYTSDALLFGTSADANRFSPWDMILSDRICASFAKIKKADYLCKTEKSAEEASASFYYFSFNTATLNIFFVWHLPIKNLADFNFWAFQLEFFG